MTFARGSLRFDDALNRPESTLGTGELLLLSMMIEENTRGNLDMTLRQVMQRRFHSLLFRLLSTNVADQSEFG